MSGPNAPTPPEFMRLPNGKTTHSFFTYCDAWTSVGRVIEERSGWRLEAFDPEFIFVAPNGESRIRLPKEYVLKLAQEEA